MASTAEATRLTQAHRRAQVAIGDQTITSLRNVWPTLDLSNLDGTFDAWLAKAAPIIRAHRAVSARVAGNYYQLFRAFELGQAATPIVPTLVEMVPAEKLATSLRVTGPISLKANIGRGMPLEQAARIADEGSAAAGMRHALDGGRQTLMQTIKADPRAQRWERVTSGNGCDFCQMLADRGAVYKEDTVDFEAHDHCTCSAEPGY